MTSARDMIFAVIFVNFMSKCQRVVDLFLAFYFVVLAAERRLR